MTERADGSTARRGGSVRRGADPRLRGAGPGALPRSLPPGAAGHFRLHFLATVATLLRQLEATYAEPGEVLRRYAFLAGYADDLAANAAPFSDARWWREALAAFEAAEPGHLPLRSVARWAGLDAAAQSLLVAIGLAEEDARFGALFEQLQSLPGVHRPTLGLLQLLWRDPADTSRVRPAIERLRAAGLVAVANPEASRAEWALQVPPPLWDALRGDAPEQPAPWLRHRPAPALATEDALVLDAALAETAPRVAALLEAGELQAVVVRGPHHGGRRTLLGAIARRAGRGLLETTGLERRDDERWRLVGPLATALHALPAIVLEPAPGETVALPDLSLGDGGAGLVLDRHGGVAGPAVERAVALRLELPGPAARQRHWEAALASEERGEGLEDAIETLRMSGGNVRRAAALARAAAALAGRRAVTFADVRAACRLLHRQALDALAAPLAADGDLADLAVAADVRDELRAVLRRCRLRERIEASGGAALRGLSAGVRVLLKGPSGTGKTLAARLLAAALYRDLWRVDLSAVVNKYIGETEKNLARTFAAAEELDVVLLFDEGDALLARRTSVQTSNDRYANLETNYLLQRIEAYEGILVVTTNAAGHLDEAFERRMDAVIEFKAPEAAERHAIWQLHLAPGHAVDPVYLREVALRCKLTGGQIRNAVLHATALALEARRPVEAPDLEAALAREYRKAGLPMPARSAAATAAGVR